ncbi:thioesterase family protein [soil metagenome]
MAERPSSNSYNQHWGDLVDLIRVLDLQPTAPGVFTAPPHLNAPRNVVEGSQLLAQSVVAASKAVPGKRAVSAYAQFSRVAGFHLPLNFQTEILQSGRTFASVSVKAEQEGKLRCPALVLLDSGSEDLIAHQLPMPLVPGPDDCPDFEYGLTGREVRFVNGDYAPFEDRIGPPELHCWIRCRDKPESPLIQQALLTQCVGHITIGASLLPHEGVKESDAHVTLSTGVMSIAIAYHADADVSGWILYSNPSIYAGRGLVQGHGTVFGQDGTLLASYTVTAMVRQFDRPVGLIDIPANQLM